MMQKIASVERIYNIQPHSNADSLEIGSVCGYKCIVKKGEFTDNDLIIFIEPDSIISESSRNITQYSFLQNKKWKISSMNLRGVKSHGLVLNKNILLQFGFSDLILAPDGLYTEKDGSKFFFALGDSVAQHIGVEHYTKPEKILPADAKGNFPSFLRKTDEPNILTWNKAFSEIVGLPVTITLKIDGQSSTFYVKDGVFGACSRNLDVKIEGNTKFNFINEKYKIQEALLKLNRNLAIQGELYGEAIQSNKLGIKGIDFAAFNLWDIDSQTYLSQKELDNFCQDNNIPVVKKLYEGIFDFTLDSLQEFANIQTYDNGTPAEGIVVRPQQEFISSALRGNRMSFKIISNKFEDKYKD
jgi:RNA ligase (TIGR02306 family)